MIDFILKHESKIWAVLMVICLIIDNYIGFWGCAIMAKLCLMESDK